MVQYPDSSEPRLLVRRHSPVVVSFVQQSFAFRMKRLDNLSVSYLLIIQAEVVPKAHPKFEYIICLHQVVSVLDGVLCKSNEESKTKCVSCLAQHLYVRIDALMLAVLMR